MKWVSPIILCFMLSLSDWAKVKVKILRTHVSIELYFIAVTFKFKSNLGSKRGIVWICVYLTANFRYISLNNSKLLYRMKINKNRSTGQILNVLRQQQNPFSDEEIAASAERQKIEWLLNRLSSTTSSSSSSSTTSSSSSSSTTSSSSSSSTTSSTEELKQWWRDKLVLKKSVRDTFWSGF